MIMKLETAAPKLTVAQALAKGSCPVCAVLKQFVDELVENLGSDQATSVCKTHTWALARAAPAEAAVAAFLKTIESRLASQPCACGICLQMHNEEGVRLRELAREMERSRMLDWFGRHGTLCLDHAEKLRKHLPEQFQPLVDQIVTRNVADFEQQLTAYREQVREGKRAGGGLLGHAAEFLAGQRGL